jgi:hypothetical protein
MIACGLERIRRHDFVFNKPNPLSHGEPVENVAHRLPLGHKLVHQGYKTCVVRWFEQVNHLVDDNIFKTPDRLSGEIGIQPNGARAVIAATPFRLHALDEVFPHPYAHQPLPSFNQWRNGLPQLLAIR